MKSVRHSMILESSNRRILKPRRVGRTAQAARLCASRRPPCPATSRELRLVKVLSDGGGYRYATSERAEQGMSDRFIRIFSESVLSMNGASNLIVIKTLSASANAAAEAIDSMKWPEVVGTLAGDNTILVVVQAEDLVETVLARLNADSY